MRRPVANPKCKHSQPSLRAGGGWRLGEWECDAIPATRQCRVPHSSHSNSFLPCWRLMCSHGSFPFFSFFFLCGKRRSSQRVATANNYWGGGEDNRKNAVFISNKPRLSAERNASEWSHIPMLCSWILQRIRVPFAKAFAACICTGGNSNKKMYLVYCNHLGILESQQRRKDLDCLHAHGKNSNTKLKY